MVKTAIIGAGKMGAAHARAYKTIPGCAVVAVADTNERAGRALAEEAGCAYASSLAGLGEVDLADICLPTDMHLPVIEEAAKLCKNIICEKPLAISPQEIRRAKELVERHDLAFMVAHVLRFADDYNKVRDMIRDGALGRPTSFVCNRRQRPPAWSANNWLMDEARSGGLAYDLLIHDIDYVSLVMGRPRRVFGAADYGDGGRPLHFKAELVYEGCTATCFGSWGMPDAFGQDGFIASLEVVGDKAMAYIDSLGRFEVTGQSAAESCAAQRRDPYANELAYMVDCVERGVKPRLSDIYAAEQTLEIVRAVCESGKTGRAVEL